MIKDVFQGAVFLIARNKLFSLVFVLLLSLFGFQRNEYEYFSVATQSIDPFIFYNYFDASFFVGCCIVLAALQYAWLRKVAPRHVSNSVAGFLACGAVSVIAVAILLLCRNFSGLTILNFVEWATFSTGHPDYFNSILLPYYDLGSIQFMGFVFPVIFFGFGLAFIVANLAAACIRHACVRLERRAAIGFILASGGRIWLAYDARNLRIGNTLLARFWTLSRVILCGSVSIH